MNWFKDGTEVSPSERIEVVVEGCVHRLNIKSALLDDQGQYMVIAGVAVSQAPLHVTGKPVFVINTVA